MNPCLFSFGHREEKPNKHILESDHCSFTQGHIETPTAHVHKLCVLYAETSPSSDDETFMEGLVWTFIGFCFLCRHNISNGLWARHAHMCMRTQAHKHTHTQNSRRQRATVQR